jgi:hypothetical protein
MAIYIVKLFVAASAALRRGRRRRTARLVSLDIEHHAVAAETVDAAILSSVGNGNFTAGRAGFIVVVDAIC